MPTLCLHVRLVAWVQDLRHQLAEGHLNANIRPA